MPARKEYPPGHPFGLLTVISSWRHPITGRWMVCCRCECGKITDISQSSLSTGASGSCGPCGRVRHGDTARNGRPCSRLYQIWVDMKRRCASYCPKRVRKWYRDKGICVCEEWSSYIVFKEWAMMHGYSDTLVLDRRNNSEGYSPGNCRWITHAESARNKTNNKWLTLWGETKIVNDWSTDSRCVVCPGTFKGRLRDGWPPESAMTTPLYGRKSSSEQ